nr:hypothetical protein CFP56_71433 [Quercus suber]
MTVKLDFTNYIVWRHQIGVILEAYAMIGFLDGSCLAPNSFLKDNSRNFTGESNPEYTSWRSREQALFTFINSRLSPSVLALTVEERAIKKKSETRDIPMAMFLQSGFNQNTTRGRGRNGNQRGREALIHAEVKAQAQDSKADDRATEADDRVAGKRPVA